MKRLSLTLLVLVSMFVATKPAVAQESDADAATDGPARAAQLHAGYSQLLQSYVKGIQVDYLTWASNWDDLKGLHDYVDALSGLDPKNWPDDDAIAYWINLYNAVTVRLILDHYPVDSIKDIGGAWKKDRVEVVGEPFSLNAIENDVLRRMTRDARIHFAINCASVGCPPLRNEAYLADRLEEQLEDSTRRALQLDTQLVVVGDTVVLSKIFGWYERDFEDDAGSVANFIERYRDDLPLDDYKLETMDYDWSLNDTRAME